MGDSVVCSVPDLVSPIGRNDGGAWGGSRSLNPEPLGYQVCARDRKAVAATTIRRKQEEEEQTNQAGCLNLLTNAVVAWNMVYMVAAIEQPRAEGYSVRDEDIAHLSPARFEHLNPYGQYLFDLTPLLHKGLRPLRQPGR